MRILLTGKKGQLGRALLPVLSSFGEVLATDRGQLNLMDSTVINQTLDSFRPHLIVNPAAFTAVDEAQKNPDEAELVNGVAPGALAIGAARIGASIIHYSTDYVFDGKLDRPYRETDPVNPMNVYATSKLAGERAVQASGAPYLIIRLSWLYAPEGENFLLTILSLALKKQKLQIIHDQRGAPTSTFVAAEITGLILRQIISTSKAPLNGKAEIIHASCLGDASWHEFAQEIFVQAQQRGLLDIIPETKPIPTSEYPLPAKRPKNSCFDLSLLQEKYRITPLHWREALSQVMDQIGR